MSLTGKTKASTYKDMLVISNSNNGMSSSVKAIEGGDGTASALSIGTRNLLFKPTIDNTSAFQVQDADGNTQFLVDTTNDLVKANGNVVNTNIQQFGLSSYLSLPSASDTADDMVGIMWYVPFHITIDSCHAWFGADAASGDVVKFSVMSYTVDTANGSTGGDLSSGVENCVSPTTIAGAGYEQAYYQALTVSTPDVNQGKVICAFVAQDGTNSDLSVNMQLVYHLR